DLHGGRVLQLGHLQPHVHRDRGRGAVAVPPARAAAGDAVVLRQGMVETEQFRRSVLTGHGRTVGAMYDSISRSQIFVLDQDEALDFYTNKLGLEVSADVDLGFMRWLTVRV